MSEQIHYGLQRTLGGLRPGHIDVFQWMEAAAIIVDWVKSAGQQVAGKRFLEVGTGRQPFVPAGLWLCGAAQTVTVDLNRYLSEAVIAESLRYLRENRDEVWELFGEEAELPGFEDRFRQLTAFSGRSPELLLLINTTYIAPTDATSIDAPDGSFDFHFSSSVFEHVPPGTIRAILDEARRILAPHGLVVHQIDTSDHFSHSDPSIAKVNFLQFDDAEWARWAGNKFMYQNRLRGYEYVELFEQAGVRILRQCPRVDLTSLEALQTGFPLDDRYRSVAAEDLAVRTTTLMGTFADG
jgi:SAM-dependent methyltransferase